MAIFQLIVYKKINGEVPVEEFLDSIDPKMRAKIYGLMEILQEKGNMLREPYSKNLDDGFMNCVANLGATLLEYYTFSTMMERLWWQMVLLKNTKNIKKEIKLAKDRRKDLIGRMTRDENIWWNVSKTNEEWRV